MSITAPAATAAWLRELGPGVNLPEVQALYAPLLATQNTHGVRRLEDLRYGAHERQALDVYAPTAGVTKVATTLQPVLVCARRWLHPR